MAHSHICPTPVPEDPIWFFWPPEVHKHMQENAHIHGGETDYWTEITEPGIKLHFQTLLLTPELWWVYHKEKTLHLFASWPCIQLVEGKECRSMYFNIKSWASKMAQQGKAAAVQAKTWNPPLKPTYGWIPSLEPTQKWKERTEPTELSSGFHICNTHITSHI